MISDVVLEVIRDQLPNDNITWQMFRGQKEPKLYGDVLILPINGFAGAQKHSHAGDPEYGQMLVRHHFGRSWYKPAAAKLAKGAWEVVVGETSGLFFSFAEPMPTLLQHVRTLESSVSGVQEQPFGGKSCGFYKLICALQQVTPQSALRYFSTCVDRTVLD